MKDRSRYIHLDELRGITLLSMILYHFLWDLVSVADISIVWYPKTPGRLWQQSICWTFILLSGFCWSLGRHPLRRGLTVLGGGCLVTAVTLIFLPENRILFGILTLLGSCTLLLYPIHRALDSFLKRIDRTGIAGLFSFFLFLVTRPVNNGYLALGLSRRPRHLSVSRIPLPVDWYANLFTTYLGFPEPSFYSMDYFSLLPWFFLFFTGYALYRFVTAHGKLSLLGKCSERPKNPFRSILIGIRWLGQHSLLLYLLHQPVFYGFTLLIIAIRE